MKNFFSRFGATIVGLLLVIFGIRANFIDLWPVQAHSFSRPVELVVLLVLVIFAIIGILTKRLKGIGFIAALLAAIYLVQLILPYKAINAAPEVVTRIAATIQIILGMFVVITALRRVLYDSDAEEEEDDYTSEDGK